VGVVRGAEVEDGIRGTLFVPPCIVCSELSFEVIGVIASDTSFDNIPNTRHGSDTESRLISSMTSSGRRRSKFGSIILDSSHNTVKVDRLQSDFVLLWLNLNFGYEVGDDHGRRVGTPDSRSMLLESEGTHERTSTSSSYDDNSIGRRPRRSFGSIIKLVGSDIVANDRG
jgi:hypothetical protein